MKLIVTERANKPGTGQGRFHFGDDVESRQSGGAISRKVVAGAEVLPIGDVVGLDFQRGFELLLGGREFALLQIDTAKSGDELGITRREGDGLVESGSGGVQLFLSDLDVGAELEGVERRTFGGVGAIE